MYVKRHFHGLNEKVTCMLIFFLPKYKIAIECQGVQHFGIDVQYNRFKYTAKDYDDIRNKDELKYKLCNEHGIRVLFFCYYKKWVPEKYIDYVYTTIKELFSELDKIKPE